MIFLDNYLKVNGWNGDYFDSSIINRGDIIAIEAKANRSFGFNETILHNRIVKNDIIKMEFDFKNGNDKKVTFYINDIKLVGSKTNQTPEILKEYDINDKIYPFVVLHGKNSSVSIV